jgi:hypothetical protein
MVGGQRQNFLEKLANGRPHGVETSLNPVDIDLLEISTLRRADMSVLYSDDCIL